MPTSKKSPKKVSVVKFVFSIMGSPGASKKAPKGLTIGNLRKTYNLESLPIKVNGFERMDDYAIADGDKVLVVTGVKNG